jgi:hypothetical protein
LELIEEKGTFIKIEGGKVDFFLVVGSAAQVMTFPSP